MSATIDRVPARRSRATLGMLVLVTGLVACEAPAFEGPQLQDPPQGYALQPDATQERAMFGHLSAVHHDAWVQSQVPYSTIHINGYSGVLTLDDVLAAQDSARAHATSPDVAFTPVEPVSIDGRDAWAWNERIDREATGLPWVAYRVMIPYDTISYTIEIATEDPALTAGAPESLTAVASTFAIGETAYNWPVIVLALGLIVLAAHLLRQRARTKADRLRSLDLVKVQTEEAEESYTESPPRGPSSAGGGSEPTA